MEAFEADPTQIRHASQATSDVGDKVQEIIKNLRGVVAATDGGWGNDDYGAEFGKGYGPARDSLNQVTENVRSHLERVSADEITAAEMLEATDRGSAQDISDVSR
ncbi:hypothetical protein [Nocardia brasiliensis]|uniref:hypothetical protein n=1 Tax=Nocardia brasiliensis TaxID=37326 RepID=UPI0033F0917F